MSIPATTRIPTGEEVEDFMDSLSVMLNANIEGVAGAQMRMFAKLTKLVMFESTLVKADQHAQQFHALRVTHPAEDNRMIAPVRAEAEEIVMKYPLDNDSED
ncbi:hypothetical protein RI367_001543 [Sorochytrium milnesiophthora]